MKKYVMTLSILMITLLLVTGCGDKKLVCKAEEIDEKVEVTYKFKDDEVSTINFKVTLKFDSEEEAKEGKEDINFLMGSVSSTEGITYDSTLKGKNIIITVTMNVAKMTDEEKEEFLGEAKTYEEIKYNAENSGSGYTCK